MTADHRAARRPTWFRAAAVAAALASLWFVAANALWAPDDPPFWAWLTFLALFVTALGSTLVGVVSRFVGAGH